MIDLILSYLLFAFLIDNRGFNGINKPKLFVKSALMQN